MSGWAIPTLLVALTAAALLAAARPRRGVAMLAGAAVLLALAGYAWQGRPGLAGHPSRLRTEATAANAIAPLAEERRAMLGSVGREAELLDAADALAARGDDDYAIATLRAGLAAAPRSMVLWLGLGQALVRYADGNVTPPARYAFDRAAALAPRHPAPAYFLGLAYAASGDAAAADAVWSALLARGIADRDARERVEVRLLLLRRLVAAANAP